MAFVYQPHAARGKSQRCGESGYKAEEKEDGEHNEMRKQMPLLDANFFSKFLAVLIEGDEKFDGSHHRRPMIKLVNQFQVMCWWCFSHCSYDF
ncbi:hypothetical protein AKJ16_DCAP08171 [Drosera capensis]